MKLRDASAAILLIGCSSSSSNNAALTTVGGSVDAAQKDNGDLAMTAAPLVPPSHTADGALVILSGLNVLDASLDQGGGIWAVTPQTVYYYPPGREVPYQYDQANGLARGESTWVDTYFSANPPQTLPVSFTAVAGATAGQALIGNEGAIADRLEVDPQSGAVLRLDNMVVTPGNSHGEEYPQHLMRVVATHSLLVNLNGPWNGTAWVGGWHGFSAFHGLTGDCNCLAFEEHQHYIPAPPAQPNYCDDTPDDTSCWDGDVWGLALSPEGDVWAGDRHFLQLLPQGSLGPDTGLFDGNFTVSVDVFPGVKDEIHGLAVDKAGGVWVASDGNGLAYLAPQTLTKTYYVAPNPLPSNHLAGAAIDSHDILWIGSAGAGLIQHSLANNTWQILTTSDGLPSNNIHNIRFDILGGSKMIVATGSGAIIYPGD